MNSTSLELRLITEKIRNRFGVLDSFENTAWDAKILDQPPGNRFLVISPHPDDDAIGCMGTLLKLHDHGAEIRILYASIQEGTFSQSTRMQEIMMAIEESGICNYKLNNSHYPDMESLKRQIMAELSEFKPDTIFVPSPFENHNEHLRAYHALADILSDDDQTNVIMYEVWGALMPNLIVPISETMDRKLNIIRLHRTQMEDIDYVRMMRGLNEYRAAMNRLDGYAESFLYMSGKDMKKVFQRRH